MIAEQGPSPRISHLADEGARGTIGAGATGSLLQEAEEDGKKEDNG
jgi:hypothetical protein